MRILKNLSQFPSAPPNLVLSVLFLGALSACDSGKAVDDTMTDSDTEQQDTADTDLTDPNEADDTGEPEDTSVGEPPPSCGDLLIQDTEECDAGLGNGREGVGCRLDCTLPVCGDGHRAPGEYCDDGNVISGDGCDAACLTEHDFLRLSEPSGSTYEVLEPNATTLFGDPVVTLSSSEHFVIRVTYDDESVADHQQDGQPLSAANQAGILSRLEEIWHVFIDDFGFVPPYYGLQNRYKTNALITDYGYLSGGTFNEGGWPEGPHPHLQMHFDATSGYHGMAHEFAHSLQNMVNTADWFDYGGWFSESHAEFMAYQFSGSGVGCSEVLVNAPHQHYGTTRNRYCNWQFLDYLSEEFSIAAVNAIWSGTIGGLTFENPFSEEIPEVCGQLDGPFATLQRNMGWSIEQLNDLFGQWAMANVNWDYTQKGDDFRDEYGTYSGPLETGARGRLTRLEAVADGGLHYVPPEILAPQRWGYNIVRLIPDAGSESIVVRFRGVVQTQSARTAAFGNYNMEPTEIPLPDSGWRWGLVAIESAGTSRYSPLQAGARASLRFDLRDSDEELYLVVLGAPTSLHQIFWDQVSYSIYRYPWRVQLENAVPQGFEPVGFPTDIAGAAHPNGGGFVAATATVSQSAYVGPAAQVLEWADVSDDVRIEGRAIVKGSARVFEQAVVKDHALIDGHAEIYGQALVHGSAQIEGGQIYDDAEVGGITWISGDTQIYGEARVLSTNTERPLRSDAQVYGTAQLLGDIEMSVPDLSAGVWYGFVHEEFMGDPLWGADRTAPEIEVTLSTQSIGWDTDGADCRYIHVGCAEGSGCVAVGDAFECVVGETTPDSYERSHLDIIAECMSQN